MSNVKTILERLSEHSVMNERVDVSGLEVQQPFSDRSESSASSNFKYEVTVREVGGFISEDEVKLVITLSNGLRIETDYDTYLDIKTTRGAVVHSANKSEINSYAGSSGGSVVGDILNLYANWMDGYF